MKKYWLYINKQNLKNSKIYGNLKKLHDDNFINVNNSSKKCSYRVLKYTLKNDFLETENFIIKKTNLITGNRKKSIKN